MQHPTAAEVKAFLAEALTPGRQVAVGKHVAICAACQSKLDRLTQIGPRDRVLLHDLRDALTGVEASIPPEIDKQVLSALAERLGTSGTGVPTPQALPPPTESQHPDAPFVPDYTLVAKLGEGAFGIVWRATDLLGNPCAIKVLPKRHKSQAGERELAGIRQAMPLRHQNLVEIRHVGELEKHWYYVMELVAETLAQRLEREPRLPPAAAQTVVISLLEALKACHDRGIAHRDIKPANIGFMADGTMKLLDLGLVTSAKRKDRTLIGTPDYMPPKPSSTPELDDLYAAGLVLYHLLTGNEPDQFPVGAASQTNDSMADQLLTVVRTACDPDPSKRFSCAADFLEACARTGGKRRIPPSVTEEVNSRKPQPQEGKTPMSPNVQNLRAAVEFLKASNLPVSDRLQQDVAALENPAYKIAVVGKYQVGKSTLINRVFIREDVLLKEGDGIPTTAVATEVVYGEKKRLEVLNWQTETVTSSNGTQSAQIRTGELVPGETIENPSAADLEKFTTADPSARTALTQRIGGVRLTWPCASLKRFTIFDTPGVDDPDHVLLANTTYRVIPQADAAILVVSPSMLDTPVLEFLRSGLFAAGLTRIMVLVSYNPETKRSSAESRSGLLAAIRAQLDQMGRGYIPVKMITYDAAVDGEILNTPDAIEQAIVEFAENNVAKGRIEKAAQICASDLRKGINELSAQLASADKSEADRLAMLAAAKKQKEELRDKYGNFSNEFLSSLRQAQRDYRDHVYVGLDKIAADYNTGFDNLSSMTDVKNRLTQAEVILRPLIEDLFFAEAKGLKADMDAAAERFKASFKQLPTTTACVGDLTIDGGLLAKVPSWILLLLDYGLIIEVFLPGHFLIAIIIRYLSGKMPIIGKFMPAAIVTRMGIKHVKDELVKTFADIKAKFGQRLEETYAAVEAKLMSGFEEYMGEELEPVIRVLSKPAAVDADKAAIGKLIEKAKAHEITLSAAIA